jgi:V/A-type H+-transporting ATPase subunit I
LAVLGVKLSSNSRSFDSGNEPGSGPDGARPAPGDTVSPAERRLTTRMLAGVRRVLVPTPMVRIGLFFLAADAPAVVSALARLRACEPDRAPTELKDYLVPYFPDDFRVAVRQLSERYDPLASRWGLTSEVDLNAFEPRVPTVEAIARLTEALQPVHERAAAIDGEVKGLRRRQVEIDHLSYQMRVLTDLGIDVAGLADLRYLHLKAGSVPAENVERLRESAELSGDVVLTLGVQEGRAHVLVVGAGSISPELEGLLARAHFTATPLGVRQTLADPIKLVADLEHEAGGLRAALEELTAQDGALRDGARPALAAAAVALGGAAVLAECEGALEGRLPVAYLGGWAPRDSLAEIEQALSREVATPVVLVHQAAPRTEAGSPIPPTEVAVPGIFQPGAVLVSLYGLPGYNEINPMFVITATTPLFFGMMFGDVGQGLLLAALALAFRRRLGRWIAPALSWSASTTVFGLLYGSVFGVEHWLPPLWLRPLNDPLRLLAVALWVGVAFLMLTFLLNAVTMGLQRRWQEAAFGLRGAAGAMMYLGGVLVLRSVYMNERPSITATTLMATGIVLALMRAAQEVRSAGTTALGAFVGEFLHEALSLVTNTLSFLRLAAFALNHGALSLALFLVVDMIPTGAAWLPGRILVFVIGSAVLLVLDTLLITVQTIRLEFYEGLTRYYRGDGRAYRPLRFTGSAST